MEFRILHIDAHMVAIEKPSGILVHRTGISADRTFVLQELRNQLGRHVYPVHRLDRGTSGVLLFALDSASASALQGSLEAAHSHKTYLAIVRGWPPPQGTIDHPLPKDITGELQAAQTSYQVLATATLPVAVDRYPTARYSLLALRLHTGRMHQIRRHMAHVRHPVVGDHKHGDRHHNRMWDEVQGLDGIFLHAWRLSFLHPVTGERLPLEASPEPRFVEACGRLGWSVADHRDFRWQDADQG